MLNASNQANQADLQANQANQANQASRAKQPKSYSQAVANNLPKQTQPQTSKTSQTANLKQAIKANYKARKVVVELQEILQDKTLNAVKLRNNINQVLIQTSKLVKIATVSKSISKKKLILTITAESTAEQLLVCK